MNGLFFHSAPWLLIVLCVATNAKAGLQAGISKLESKPEIVVQMGHSGQVTSLAFSSNGRYFVSGSIDGKIKLWNVITGKEMRTFAGHSDYVESVVFTPDAGHVLSASRDASIRIWDTTSGRMIRNDTGHSGYVVALAISADGLRYASASWDNSIRVWDTNTGRVVHQLNGHKEFVNSVAFSPDGKFILSGSSDKSMKLWDARSGRLLRTFTGHQSVVRVVSFSANGKNAFSCSHDRSIKLWNVASGALIRTFTGHTNNVHALALSPDGKTLLSASIDRTIRLWSVTSGKELRRITDAGAQTYWALAFSPDGNKIIAGADDASIQMWDARNGQALHAFLGRADKIAAVALSPNGKQAVMAGSDLVLWDFAAARPIRWYKGNSKDIRSVVFSPDGKVLVAGSSDKAILLWNVESAKLLKQFTGLRGSVSELAFAPDGKHLLSGDSADDITYWDIESGTKIWSQPYNQYGLHNFIISPDGKNALISASNHDLSLWELATGKMLYSRRWNSSTILSAAFLPDGGKTVLGWFDRKVMLWDVAAGKELRTFSGDAGGWVEALAVSSDGQRVLSGHSDNTLKIWDIASGNLKETLVGHANAVKSVSFLPGNNYALSAASDATMRLWNLSSGEWTSFMRTANAEQWIVFNSDGYWDGSPNCGDLVGMSYGFESWTIDQFAVRNNRPDIILSKIPDANRQQMEYYSVLYNKRLRKLGFTDIQGNPDKALVTSQNHVPTASIVLAIARGEFAELKGSCSDSMYALKGYSVFVNDVPLYGALGKSLKGNSAAVGETIKLSSGENKIELSCMNEQGVESYRALSLITHTPKAATRPKLYFLGFGVSKYKNGTLNLVYADKDVRDLAAKFTQMNDAYVQVVTKVFVNEEVNAKNLAEAKTFVANADVDDTFVLFIAGHGLHDSNRDATYYYLTHDTDLDDLAHTAANFELIEDLLQGIAPRKKLFLMDTCESGEAEEDTSPVLMAQASGQNIKPRAARGLTVRRKAKNIAPRSFITQKDRYIDNDLIRRSGAIIFSSSRGGEFSYESDQVRNGFFTKKVIDALSGQAAVENGMVSVDALRKYVSEEVAKMSQDLQHPTVDRDNLYQKFSFPVCK